MEKVTVIGAGLAGCEAAYCLSRAGIKVDLIECKPFKKSPAHQTDNFAELVCSNSLKSQDLATASGLLKAELKMFDSLLLKIAEQCLVAAGGALAVDRNIFSQKVTQHISSDKNITIINEEVNDWDTESYTIIATGPLTLGGLESKILSRFGNNLYFYDAAAPIVSADSLDNSKVFAAGRYNKGGDDYLNCAMDKLQYEEFVKAINGAECARLSSFEKSDVFSGCMPVEAMAKRGNDTLRFGPLKPVGITDPIRGNRPYAVVQLRAENKEKTMYNLVGFQTNLKFNEQKRVFSLIPGLENAEFLRYGVMHRNSFINAPKVINSCFQTLKYPKTFIAGQLSGVEGYVESMGSGLIAGLNVARSVMNMPPIILPKTTVMGALMNHLSVPSVSFQPMNANFGLLPAFNPHIKDKDERKAEFAKRSISDLTDFKIANELI